MYFNRQHLKSMMNDLLSPPQWQIQDLPWKKYPGPAIGMPDTLVLSYRRHVIRTNLNPMGSRPPMALSERPQHTALSPLLGTVYETPKWLVWPPSGTVLESWVYASNGTVSTRYLGHCMGNPKRTRLGLLWHCLRCPCTLLISPIGTVYKILKGPVLTLLWHCIAFSGTTVWASHSTSFLARACMPGHRVALHVELRRVGLGVTWHCILCLNSPVWASHGTTFLVKRNGLGRPLHYM